jgi:hypothetical protein
MIVFTQPDARFRGPAYEYVREADALPSIDELADDDPLCKVKLFLAGSRWTYFVAAVTRYDEQTVMTGYCVSPLGPDCDEWGDESLDRVAALRVLGIPPERDLHYEPTRLSEIRRRPDAH